MSPQRFRQRPSRVVPSVIVALVLALLGAAGLWAGITRLSQNAWPPIVTDTLRTVAAWRWESDAVLIAASVLGALGVILLLAVVVPGRRPGYALRPRVAENARETLTDRGLDRIVAAHATRVNGVESARAVTRGRALVLRVATPLREGAPVKVAAHADADATIAALPLMRSVTAKVDVRTPKEVR